MSILEAAKRELVDFNPTDIQHRQWVHEALEHQSWGRCPVRFRTQMKDMETTVKSFLLDYYLTKEFG